MDATKSKAEIPGQFPSGFSCFVGGGTGYTLFVVEWSFLDC